MGENVAREVRELIDEDAFLRVPLAMGLMNHSKLAERLIDEFGVNGEKEAVVSALIRYRDELAQEELPDQPIRLEGTQVAVRTNICLLFFPKTTAVRERLEEVETTIDSVKEPVHLLTGDDHLGAFVRRKHVSKVEKEVGMPAENKHEDLEAIVVMFADEPSGSFDPHWIISHALRSRGIRPRAVLATDREHHVFVDSDSGREAYDVLHELSKGD